MHKQKVILIGPCGGGSVPKNGASAKNYHLVKFLREKNAKIQTIDTENWRKNPLVLIKLACKILFNPNAKFIVATNNMSSYRVFQIFSMFPRKRSIIYWIIGGSIAEWIKEGKVGRKPFECVEWFLAEGKKMQRTFAEVGFKDNVLYVPNFKNISYIPNKVENNSALTKFVFLSRVIPMKGCDLIIEAVNKLNTKYQNRFIVDFYGPIEDNYDDDFKSKVESLPNVNYKGFIDLRNEKNYDVLASYDSMLFPTYWHGEGFPGIIIDAFIAGLPVIASDWSLNADIIEDGKTGMMINVKDVDALAGAMTKLIENRTLINTMSKQCSAHAMEYEMNNVLSADLFKKIGIEL